MAKLSENQVAARDALVAATIEANPPVQFLSKAAWKKAAPGNVTINPASMVKAGAVTAHKAVISTNGKVIEVYAPVPAQAES